jgi:hypothetical protein
VRGWLDTHLPAKQCNPLTQEATLTVSRPATNFVGERVSLNRKMPQLLRNPMFTYA